MLIATLSIASLSYAVQNASLGITFNGQGAISFNPLSFTQSESVFSGDSQNISIPNVLMVQVFSNQVSLHLHSTTLGTNSIFLNLTLTLILGSTSIMLNGLSNETLTQILARGVYSLSLNLSYTVLGNVDNQTASWNVILS